MALRQDARLESSDDTLQEPIVDLHSTVLVPYIAHLFSLTYIEEEGLHVACNDEVGESKQ